MFYRVLKLCVLFLTTTPFITQSQIPTLNLDIDNVTVSGLSSGGYMANQFHIAHSDWVNGAAIIAAGPYYCAQSSIGTALSQCVNKSDAPIQLEVLNQKVNEYQNQDAIAPLAFLKKSRIWLLHGNKDTKIASAVANSLYEQYAQWITPENIRYIKKKSFAHHFPTVAIGSVCEQSESPFLGNCGYDAAGEMLAFLYGDLKAKSEHSNGQIVKFNQHELGGKTAKSLAEDGYAFIPDSCAEGQSCKVHVSFHGCNQNAKSVGTQYVKGTGLNQWASANNLVVLYPQTTSSMMMPLNPQGCWDWWGYTDEWYATQKGQQIQAVTNMVRALTNNTAD